jgi:hypothetical protein
MDLVERVRLYVAIEAYAGTVTQLFIKRYVNGACSCLDDDGSQTLVCRGFLMASSCGFFATKEVCANVTISRSSHHGRNIHGRLN